MTAKLYALADDPDTKKAQKLLTKKKIAYHVVDVEKEGILAHLDRDLGVSELPFVILDSKKYEGLEQIRTLAKK